MGLTVSVLVRVISVDTVFVAVYVFSHLIVAIRLKSVGMGWTLSSEALFVALGGSINGLPPVGGEFARQRLDCTKI